MTYREALDVLDIDDRNESREMLKAQYRWLVWFYHPDNKETGHKEEFQRVVKAYEIVSILWKSL